MLFNSQIFLIGFLPVTLFLYYKFSSRQTLREWFLILASVVFYAYWDVRLVGLLLASVALNWILVRFCDEVEKNYLLTFGILINLAVIGIFKYADFFASSAGWLFSFHHDSWNIVLPLGISFFTFQQISYLIDHQRGDAPPYSFRQYFLYIAFFPQLIAGPIVRHNEFIFQLVQSPKREGLEERLSRGVTLFFVGMCKKVLIADMVSPIANQLFGHASTSSLSMMDGWIAALSFTFQIYFDFSGYSDMAIGLALMFGFTLPVNFNIPYRADSIRDFWRRWHMTLSHFLRDYLYIPLGGSRNGPARQMLAVLVTMLVGGLWHGAGWTFVIWGGLHGVALVVNGAWQRHASMNRILGWAITMLFVVMTWVLFRATDFAQASSVLKSMIGLGDNAAQNIGDYNGHLWMIAVAAIISVAGPSSQDVVLKRQFNKPWLAVGVGLALVTIAIELGSTFTPEFIYFQF